MTHHRFGTEIPDEGKLPEVFEMCIDYLESFALNKVGILRISGQRDNVNKMKQEIEEGKRFQFLESDDIHDVAGILRLWLHLLPEPLIPFHLYHAFLEANKSKRKLSSIKKLFSELPPLRFQVLKRLCRLLRLVAVNAEVNMMTPESISIVMTPNILRPETVTMEGISETQQAAGIVLLLIKEYDSLFKEKKFQSSDVKHHLEQKFSKIKIGENPLHGKKHKDVEILTPETIKTGKEDEYETERKKEYEKESLDDDDQDVNNDESNNRLVYGDHRHNSFQHSKTQSLSPHPKLSSRNYLSNSSIDILKPNDITHDMPQHKVPKISFQDDSMTDETSQKPKQSEYKRKRAFSNALEWLIAIQEDGTIDEMTIDESIQEEKRKSEELIENKMKERGHKPNKSHE